MALIANVHRDRKKSKALKPSDFDPFAASKTKLKEKADVSILKTIFVDGAQAVRKVAPLLLLAFVLAGCASAKLTIDRSQKAIEEHAAETVTEIDAAIETGEVGERAVPHLERAKDNQYAIQREVTVTRRALHGVDDRTPWWARLASNAVLAALFIAIAIVLWQSGVGFLMRRIAYAIGLFIPRGTRASAALDAEAIVQRRASQPQREAIAARRAADPAYECEFLRQKRRAEDRFNHKGFITNMEVHT
ncbi:MAG TPA: hypothetical protein PK098_06695 [Phycisphaerales bacterium]|nr:hypothetical protein [Phycisphaerales bacterium]